jgi:hypothetical protein
MGDRVLFQLDFAMSLQYLSQTCYSVWFFRNKLPVPFIRMTQSRKRCFTDEQEAQSTKWETRRSEAADSTLEPSA